MTESGQDFMILPDPSRLEALAEFAAGAGHEINNPLATIIGRAQLLLKDETDPQRRQMLLSIGAQAYRIRDMIGDTMLFGRPPLPEISQVNLLIAIEQVLANQRDPLSQSNCSVQVDADSSIAVLADPTQLAIVLSELLFNSQQALYPNGGEIRIAAQSASNFIEIRISDTGKGFTETERLHAFNPFFSGRQAGRGLGFGLPKCWRIIEQHHGQIQIQSSPTGPTQISISWPRAETLPPTSGWEPK